MKTYIFRTEQFIDKPVETVFEYFSKADNLDNVTPSHLRFQILTPLPIDMKLGTRIQYRLRLYGIPIRWDTEITDWEPPFRFVDTQVKGPYKKWVHEHRFLKKDGGTKMIDTVEYAVPGYIFAPLIHSWFVRPDIKKIFQFRETRFKQIFRENP